MADATGETKEPLRVAFDRRLKLEFHGARITSDAGLLAYRELDYALGLTAIGVSALAEGRRGTNIRHRLLGLLRQAVYGRLAGYEDVNDAERLARDPAMRAIVGREGLERPAASTSEMGRFETGWLATEANLVALADLSGTWIDLVRERRPPDGIMLDMDSSESPTYGRQEGSAYNGHFGRTCYHPLFVFNQFGDLERCALRPRNVHSAEGWREVLEPVIARYRERDCVLYFRGDAGFAKPELYEQLEGEGIGYAIRLPANRVLQERIGHLLTRPVGRPPMKPQVFFASFSYQAQSWTKPRRVVAKVEWHQGELYPRVGFIVTNLTRPAERISKFYNGRGTAEQWIKEGKQALCWTRLSCHDFRDNAVRLQLFALAYNLANFLRSLALPNEVAQWSLTTLREKLVKIGARIVRHGRYVVFQLAKVAVVAGAIRRDPAPDRPTARTARCGGLTRADRGGAARAEGGNRAPRSTSTARADRVSPPTGLRRLLPSGIRRQTSVPLDRKWAEQQPSGRQPSQSGECRLIALERDQIVAATGGDLLGNRGSAGEPVQADQTAAQVQAVEQLGQHRKLAPLGLRRTLRQHQPVLHRERADQTLSTGLGRLSQKRLTKRFRPFRLPRRIYPQGSDMHNTEQSLKGSLSRRALMGQAAVTALTMASEPSLGATAINVLNDLTKEFATSLELSSQNYHFREYAKDFPKLQLERAPSKVRPSETPISLRSKELIIAFEVSSDKIYSLKYTRPIYPGEQSGITIGIGYDLGYTTAEQFAEDWKIIPNYDEKIVRLSKFCQLIGKDAKDNVDRVNDIEIDWKSASTQFDLELKKYVGLTQSNLPNFNLLSEDSRGALVSLVYNRGPSFDVPVENDQRLRYQEMRNIRQLMIQQRFSGIPKQITDMTRLWPSLPGLVKRRKAEAALFEVGLG